VVGVDDRVKHVKGKVQDVHDDVQDVGDKIQDVDDRVEGVGDKLDRIFYDGFRPPIHPPIITSHAKPITMAHLNGFSVDFHRPAPCGYTGNVRYS